MGGLFSNIITQSDQDQTEFSFYHALKKDSKYIKMDVFIFNIHPYDPIPERVAKYKDI